MHYKGSLKEGLHCMETKYKQSSGLHCNLEETHFPNRSTALQTYFASVDACCNLALAHSEEGHQQAWAGPLQSNLLSKPMMAAPQLKLS